MTYRNGSRFSAVVAMTAVMIGVAGGGAVASNMGFKLNKPLALFQPPPAPTTSVGDNWTSLPFSNPYTNIGSFCSQLGLTSTGVIGAPRAMVTWINAATGGATTAGCGTATAFVTPMPPVGSGVRIRQPSIAGAPSSTIIVGSHDPGVTITVPKAGMGTVGDLWFSVPYHTTAATFNDLCLTAGLTSTGAVGAPRASITRVAASTGAAVSAQCGTTTAQATNLVLGEAVRMREPNGPKIFVPAHF